MGLSQLAPVGLTDPFDLYTDGVTPDGVELDVADTRDDIAGRDTRPRLEDGPQDVTQTPDPDQTTTEA